MEQVVDPVADWIFDAAVIDISDRGTVETVPITDEDWLRVERGALILAETANLLMMPRAMAEPGDEGLKAPRGGSELTPPEIEARIKADPELWNREADGLRLAALESLASIRTHDADALFDVGSRIDRACESCHLEFWYPGDKPAVLENQRKTVSYDKPKT